jgi:iron complex outermembrane receptor protein
MMSARPVSCNRAVRVCALVGLLLLALTTAVHAQTTTTGTVSVQGGGALPGTTVTIKGTATRTATNASGQYTLVASATDVLVFSSSGFETQEITVGQNSVIDAVMVAGIKDEITVIGSRAPRSSLDRPVPVDVIEVQELHDTAQIDLAQSLHYAVPSFNAVKFGINDLAPLIDPATLRGLAPDQTLLLVNGKRRHKVSFFGLNHGVGKGQLGNDMNAVPSAAIKRVEILRDGAAAQYGSDAIAGVINLVLNDARSGGSIRTYTGVAYSNPKYDGVQTRGQPGENIYGSGEVTDGATFSTSVNFGLPWGETGFVNTTLWAHQNDAYDRSGFYTHSAGWYPDDPNLSQAENEAEDERLRRLNGIDLDRAVLGGAKNTNSGIFINAGRPMDENWDFYLFGGFSRKEVVGGIFSRAAARTDRSALDIFPNGFNPETPAILEDWQVVTGARGDIGDWALDLSIGHGSNSLDLYNRNTVNPSLGSASPTEFYTGSLDVTQTLLNADFSKAFGNTTFAFGTEVRFESFEQTQGQAESWIPGPLATQGKDVGSTGREGYSDATDGKWNRNNLGIYAEVESDISEDFLVGVAARFEKYSDFGNDTSYKATARYRFSPTFSLRGSVSRSFRAPALAQLHYSNFVQIAFDNAGDSIVTPFLPIRNVLVQEAFGITELEPETSFDVAIGITSQPSANLSFTLDVYQIKIDDRIIVSGGIDASDFPTFDGAGYDEINIFTNAVDTTTEGLDLVLNYSKVYGNDRLLSLALAANFNDTEVTALNVPPAFGESDIIDDRDIVFLTNGTPKSKIIGSVSYQIGKFGLLARFTNFGEVQDARETDPATGNAQVFSSQTVTDFSVTANLTPDFALTFAVNNLLDEYPDMLITPNVRGEVIYSRRTNQFGTLGRFVNLSMLFKW